MSGSATCRQCGASLKGAAHALCPRCLVKLGLELNTAAGSGASAAAPAPEEPGHIVNTATERVTLHSAPRRFGDFELLEERARGGMGVVFKARQMSLNRVVALKMIVGGPLASTAAIQRFQAEARAAAGLQHPHIVAIHEIGEHDGQPFFSMDYVEGRNLAELLRDGPLTPRKAASYAKVIAEAVHYAHQRGILHRDLKPSNVLIDQFNEPRITDFGLAKRLNTDHGSLVTDHSKGARRSDPASVISDSSSELTLSGQVLGSPNFIAPEQAQGRQREVGAPSDVYSLGALLYHLLTGRPPFQAATLTEVLRQVVATEPAAPRLLNPSIPRDLETICLKCLEKDIPRRYATAQALAEDLGHFLRGESIEARPVGPAGRAWRWGRRNPQLAAAAGVAFLSLVIGLAGVTWQWRRAESQRQRAEAGEWLAQRRAYISEINSAHQALRANNPSRALELLNRHRPGVISGIQNPKSAIDLRGFEWCYLWQECQIEAEGVVGRLQNNIRSLEVSPSDGQWLFATSDGGSVRLWNLLSGEEISLATEQGVMACAAFSPTGRWLFYCDQNPRSAGTIAGWDLQARQRLAPIVDTRPIGPMSFSPDGQWFGYGVGLPSERKASFGKGLVLVALPSREKVKEIVSLTEIVDTDHATDWVFTPDSRNVIFAEADPDRRLAFCDLLAGSEPRYISPCHSEAVTAMAISPDGRILATGAGYTNRNIRLWEVPSFRLLDELLGHRGWIRALRFSPDGRTLASAGADQTILLWDVATRRTRRILSGLPAVVSRLCFTPDGQTLFSGGIDGTIFRWAAQARKAEPKPPFWSNPVGLESVTMTPDANGFAGLRQGGAYVGEAQAVTPPSQIQDLGTNNTCLLFSSDGTCLFAGTETGEIQVWSLDRRERIRLLRGPTAPVGTLRQDLQGHLLVAAHWEKKARLDLPAQVTAWNTSDWRRQQSWTIAEAPYTYEVSPDGRWLAAAFHRGPLRLWNLNNASETRTVSSAGGTVAIGFSPDGRLMAAATVEGVVRVWEMPTLRGPTQFQARSKALFALAFSPDSQRLATAGEGAEAIQLWEVTTWQELIVLERPGEQINQLGFSADGSQLSALTSQSELLFWRVPPLGGN